MEPRIWHSTYLYSIAAAQQKIRELTRQAQDYLTAHQHDKLPDVLKAASKLQHHNSRIFKTIDRTERRLAAIAEQVAKEAPEVKNA